MSNNRDDKAKKNFKRSTLVDEKDSRKLAEKYVSLFKSPEGETEKNL